MMIAIMMTSYLPKRWTSFLGFIFRSLDFDEFRFGKTNQCYVSRNLLEDKRNQRERERVGVPIYVRTRERVYIGKEERESVCI